MRDVAWRAEGRVEKKIKGKNTTGQIRIMITSNGREGDEVKCAYVRVECLSCGTVRVDFAGESPRKG